MKALDPSPPKPYQPSPPVWEGTEPYHGPHSKKSVSRRSRDWLPSACGPTAQSWEQNTKRSHLCSQPEQNETTCPIPNEAGNLTFPTRISCPLTVSKY